MKTTLYAIASILILSSCNKYLDKQPLDQPVTTNYYVNQDQIFQGLTGVYNSTYWTVGLNIPIQVLYDLYTEIGVERYPGIASGSFDATNGTIASAWSYMYSTIARANALLDGMKRGKNNTPSNIYNQYEAEAKVLRAWAYYNLIGLYGDVPYYTTPLVPSQFYVLKRTDRNLIADSLMNDLDDAASNLDWYSPQRGRVNKGVALGLKAKIAMLVGKYDIAANAANAVIQSGAYGLNPNYGALFTRAGQDANVNNEIMFLLPLPDDQQYPVTYVGLGQGSRNVGGQCGRFPTQQLVDKFECIDGKRIDQSPLYDPANPSKNRDPRLHWTVTMNGDTIAGLAGGAKKRCVYNIYDPTTSFYNYSNGTWQNLTNNDVSNPFGPVKNGVGYLWAKYSYDINQDFFKSKTGFIYMRYAEILLTYAEAKIELGQIDASVIAAINQVRNRAGMPNVDPSIIGNQNKMRQLVRREKIVELANEGIHLFDMRRWNTGKIVLNDYVWGASLSKTNPAPIPSFGAPGSFTDLNDIADYSNGNGLRFKRELRSFQDPKNNLWPIPQRELDLDKNLTQNTGW
ncbi:MAG: RagB/SusD family nutrient uptake outer membrane protein [Thermoflavifilum sp.]|nr:RagB/SusD family nutrient uptake outer membrane protein [Thermoflavifilum sp.]